MDYGNMIGESFAYAKDALVGKWMQWVLFLVATILLAIPLMGYSLKVLRGEKPAPELADWGTLIIDGIKYLIVSFIWAIPLLIIYVVMLGSMAGAIVTGDPATALAFVGGAILSFVIFVIVAFITGLLATIGIVQFARSGSIGEAFNFGAIIATIGKLGWISYFIALVIIGIILCIIEIIGMAIPVLGPILLFILIPLLVLWHARYVCLIYDSVSPA
jgi:hypothetical protein